MKQGVRVGLHTGLARARWLPLTAAILVATSCATSVTKFPAHSPVTNVDATESSSGTALTNRLTVTVTYQSGQERFDPLPAGYQPKIDAAQAFAAFARSNDPSSLGTKEKPTILLASYTNFTTGKHATFVTGTMDPVAAARSDDASKPWWTAVPVWYIRYLRVPMVSAGAPPAPGQTYQQPKTVIQEMVVPVSAETGQVLMTENASADQTPTSWPPPAYGSGDTAKSSAVNADQTSSKTTH